MQNDFSSSDQPIYVTREAVFKSCDLLWSQKEVPSPQKVREMLGSGSMTTINKYIKLWRAEEWNQNIPDALNKAVNELRRQIRNESKDDIKKIEQEASQKVREAQDRQHAIEQEHEITVKQLQELNIFSNNLQESNQSLNKKYNEQEKEFYITQKEKLSLEKELQDSKKEAERKLNAQSRDYENRITQLNKQTEQDKKQLSDKINLLEKDRDELKQSFGNHITDLKIKIQGLESNIKQAHDKEKTYKTEIDKYNAQYGKAQKDIHDLQNEKLILSQEMHNREKELSISQEKLKQFQSQIDELKLQNKELQKLLLDRVGRLEQKISSRKRKKM